MKHVTACNHHVELIFQWGASGSMFSCHAFLVGYTFDVTIQIHWPLTQYWHQARLLLWVGSQYTHSLYSAIFSHSYLNLYFPLCCRHCLLCNSVRFTELMFHRKWRMMHKRTTAWSFSRYVNKSNSCCI